MHVDDTEGFIGLVKSKLIEHDYDVIRKFARRSSFTTFITAVIMRLLAAYRVSNEEVAPVGRGETAGAESATVRNERIPAAYLFVPALVSVALYGYLG